MAGAIVRAIGFGAILLALPLWAADAPPAKPGAAAAATSTESTAPTKSEAPLTAEQQAVRTRMEELFTASRGVNGVEKVKARETIEKALDWDAVAKSCLGDAQWKKTPAGQRNEFRGLLKDVIVRTAYSRMDKFWESTKFDFDKIEVKGSDASVVTKFVVSNEPFVLEYFLARKGKTWILKDIAFEDMRYSTNINEQITSFLKEKKFSELLQNLKKRRDELGTEKKAPAKG